MGINQFMINTFRGNSMTLMEEEARKYLMKFSSFRYWCSAEHDIDLHKYYESKKIGYDIGHDRAVVDWTIKIAKNFFYTHPSNNEK